MQRLREKATDQLSTTDHLRSAVNAHINIARLAQVDSQLRELAKLDGMAAPRSGWVKTLRLAMGMSSAALGQRLDMSGQGVRQLERAESNGTITLNTLSRLADGLDCDVRYVLVPRTSLVDKVLKRAQEHAARMNSRVTIPGQLDLHDPEGLLQIADLLSGFNRRGFW